MTQPGPYAPESSTIARCVAPAIIVTLLAQGAAAQPPPATVPAAGADAATTENPVPGAEAPAVAPADSTLAAKYAEDEKRRAREFARRNGYILHYQDGQYLFCREAEGVTGSRVKKQRRCINREQAELEELAARELADKVNKGHTPRDLPGGPGS